MQAVGQEGVSSPGPRKCPYPRDAAARYAGDWPPTAVRSRREKTPRRAALVEVRHAVLNGWDIDAGGRAALVLELGTLPRRPPNCGPRASFRAIAERLNTDGHTTRQGAAWYLAQVALVLADGRP